MAGKYNKHKQDGSHLGFPIRMILATVDLQVTSILPMNFESIALSFQEKKFKMDFQWPPWPQSGISYRKDLAIFNLQVTPMLPDKFRVNRPFSSGENRFSRWPPTWISIGTILAIFDLQVIMMLNSYQFSNQLVL